MNGPSVTSGSAPSRFLTVLAVLDRRVRAFTDEERAALVAHDHVTLFEMGAHPFLTLTLFIAMFERDHPEPLAYQKAYGAALAHLGLPYPDIST